MPHHHLLVLTPVSTKLSQIPNLGKTEGIKFSATNDVDDLVD
jgi:hypothetical protein